MSEDLIRIAPVAALKEGAGHAFDTGDDEIAVFLIDGNIYAVSNVCPHQHVPLIAEGPVKGTVVTCPMHGWRYNLATGRAVSAAGSIKTYETLIKDGILYIRKPEPETLNW